MDPHMSPQAGLEPIVVDKPIVGSKTPLPLGAGREVP